MKTTLFANSTLAFGIISLICLAALHIVSSEIKPNFRMVSEYALGNHKWLLTIFFLCWGLCTITSGLMLWNQVSGIWATLGVVLLFVSGVGAIMGGLFDIQHKLHGMSFAIGVPFMPIAALLISYHLINKPEWQGHSALLLTSAHSTWISIILMAGSMFLLFSTLKAAGVPYGPEAPPLTELPNGVIGLSGWANRLLVLCYVAFPLVTARIMLHILVSGK